MAMGDGTVFACWSGLVSRVRFFSKYYSKLIITLLINSKYGQCELFFHLVLT